MIFKAINIAIIGLLIAAPMTADHTQAITGNSETSTAGTHGTPPPIIIEPIKEIEPIEPITAEPIAEIVPIEEAVIAEPEPVAPSQSDGNGMTPDQLMDAVGIVGSERYYANCVINGCEGVSPEGGWAGVTRWNTAGSGAYGICQALPASKMAQAGADYMTNALTQLKWCHQYAVGGYGSWQQAFQFRKCVGSCYSPRTGGYVNKDHTWW